MFNDALTIYRAIGAKDFGRVDFRVKDGISYFLEINPLPTLCEDGSFEICAHAVGKSFADILSDIINSSAIRQNLVK